MTNHFQLGERRLGAGQPVFVIAEAGVNHNGDVDLAHQLIDAAAEAGADAVKFQTFAADRLVTRTAPKAAYQLSTTDAAESQYDMLKRLELSPEAHRVLLAHSRQRSLEFLSTPFDAESADLLESLDILAFKVGSGELTDLPLLAHIARKGRPMLVSTGMSWLGEVEQAVRTVRAAGLEQLALLHCVSNYPAQETDINLRALDTLRHAFGVPVGYSDHTPGIIMPAAAVALGACIIEKHFTLSQALPGPDHKASLEPRSFALMVRGIREVEAALGDGFKRPMPREQNTRDVVRKSVVALRDISQGEELRLSMLGVRRPGTGFPPADLEHLLGRRARMDISAGAALTWDLLA